MASEDFSINIGLHIDDKEVRSKIKDLEKNAIAPLQERLGKVQRGTHEKLIQDFVKVSHEYHRLMGGAITPAQAVRYAAGGTPPTGTARRGITESATHLLQKRLKEEQQKRQIASKRAEDEARMREGLRRLETREKSPLEKVQDTVRFSTQKSLALENISKQQLAAQTERDMQKLYMHLGAMEGVATPFDRVLGNAQDKIRYETFQNAEKQITDARNEEERRLALEEHQAQILEIIAKNTGIFKKWGQVDKAIVQREQRSILRSLTPGEGLTDYQRKVLGTGFGVDFKKLASTGLSFAGVVGGIAKLVGRELVREGSLLSKQASITGYSLQKERTLSDMGMKDASSVMSDIATFNDRLRLGEVDLQGYGMFARRTLATRRQTNDPLAIWQAFKMDVAEAEARGWTKETVAQKTGMTAWLPTLKMKEEDVAKLWGRAASGIEQEKRAYGAHMRGKWFRNVGRSIDDLTSDEKAATIAGQILGGAGAAATVAMTGGTALIPLAAAGVAGATAGGVGSALLADQLPDSAVSLADVQDTVRNAPNTTVNVRIDSDAMQTLINGNEYTKTFSVSSISDMY